MAKNTFALLYLAIVNTICFNSWVHCSNAEGDLCKLYSAIALADIEVVEKFLGKDRLLATSVYKKNPMIKSLLKATRFKNNVAESQLKNYVAILKMLGKSAATEPLCSKLGTVVTPLDYALKRCHCEIEEELLKFEPKPTDYKVLTDEMRIKLAGIAHCFVPLFASFLGKQINLMFSKDLTKVKKTRVSTFAGRVRDAQNRVLSGTVIGNLDAKDSRKFVVRVFSAKKESGKMRFSVSWLAESINVLITILETPEKERQNGMGGMMLDALITAFKSFKKNVSITLYAYPYDNEKELEIYKPLLIHFYKKRGFLPDKNDAQNLKLTLINEPNVNRLNHSK